MVASSLQDVESKYGKAIERITLLEDELIEKSKLEEEHQRLKDDLRGWSMDIQCKCITLTNAIFCAFFKI
jgi:FtsZ-binding cell division protein ZapB